MYSTSRAYAVCVCLVTPFFWGIAFIAKKIPYSNITHLPCPTLTYLSQQHKIIEWQHFLLQKNRLPSENKYAKQRIFECWLRKLDFCNSYSCQLHTCNVHSHTCSYGLILVDKFSLLYIVSFSCVIHVKAVLNMQIAPPISYTDVKRCQQSLA